MSGLGPSFMKIWTCGSSPWSGSWNAWMQIKNVNGASCLSKFWNFFSTIQRISCHDWWLWTKPGYITMTWRQSNNQWNDNIADHPAPKNSKCKNPLEKFLPRFFGIDGILLTDHLPKGQTINVEYYSSLLVQLKDTLKEKHRRKVTKGSCSCMAMPRLTRHLQPRRNRPTWASSVLITHPILRIWPHWITACSLDCKNNWKVAIFHLTWRSLLLWRPGWTDNLLNFFWVACKSYSIVLRSVLSFVGSMLNKSRVWLL